MDSGGYWNSSNYNSSNFTINFEFWELFLGKHVPWSQAVYISILLIGATANVLLLLAIRKDPLKCFRNPTMYFISNLAIADLLNSLFHLQEMLLSLTKYKSITCLSGAWKRFNLSFLIFVYLLTFPCVSILALERYVSIARPLWHQVNVTSRLCFVCIAVVWTLGFCTVITDLFSKLTGLITAYESVFLLTTTIIYILALISIRKQDSSLASDNSNSEIVRRMIKKRLKSQNRFLTTVFISNAFLIFGMIPTMVGIYWRYSLEEQMISTNAQVVFYLMDILYLLNVAANPFLYVWRLPKYRRTFLVMYRCKKL